MIANWFSHHNATPSDVFEDHPVFESYVCENNLFLYVTLTLIRSLSLMTDVNVPFLCSFYFSCVLRDIYVVLHFHLNQNWTTIYAHFLFDFLIVVRLSRV